jgi:hypothetical protein
MQNYLVRENTKCLEILLKEQTIKATKNIGFSNINTFRIDHNIMAIIGQDSHGRNLVHELQVTENAMPLLRSEVLGIHDNKCSAIMDNFQNELSRLGTGIQLPSHRKATGGIATLTTSKTIQQEKTQRSKIRKQATKKIMVHK